MNLGTALLAAAVARVYVNGGADGTVVLWIICVILLIWLGLKISLLLDGEARAMEVPTFGEFFPAIVAVVVAISGWLGAHYIVRHKHDGSRARRP